MTTAICPVHRLEVRTAFESLSSHEKLYAYHMSQAAWKGTRIILRQVSPEANEIFDFILELYHSCSGKWTRLASKCDVPLDEVNAFLEYAATFLSNIGNFYGSGDQKFVPDVSRITLERLSRVSKKAERLFANVSEPMTVVPPHSLGFPSDIAQSAYYPGTTLSREEISSVSASMEKRGILLENTRLQKVSDGNHVTFEVLQGSAESDISSEFSIDHGQYAGMLVRVVRGDHSAELASVCDSLRKATEYAATEEQGRFLSEYVDSFMSGSLDAYRASQRTWVKDVSARVENIFGFVEPYRDPYGVRAEWEALVAISDTTETRRLQRLVEHSTKFISQLPWVVGESKMEKFGPFEKDLFEPPDLTSLHGELSTADSYVMLSVALTTSIAKLWHIARASSSQYNDIRQECGFKNLIIANRMSAESSNVVSSSYIPSAEVEAFQKHKFATYYLWVVLHELFGHGTSKLLSETSKGNYNFDIENPPVNPITSKPITSWYKLGQSWTSKFEDLSTTVDECRCELVGAYLLDDPDLLALFGYTDESEISAADLAYNMYQQLGVDGLRGLQNFNVGSGNWGQAHSQAHFATLKWLLMDGGGFMHIESDATTNTLIVHVDRSRIISHGKQALGRMLLRLHMYRCTADAEACRAYYEELSKVDGEYLIWRNIVLTKKEPKWKFVQANTFLHGEDVVLKEYDASNEGIIQSWAERSY